MFKWLKNGTRFILVTVGIVTLTSFTIDATDSLSDSQTALGILSQKLTESGCGDGMVKIISGEKSFCVDVFEASPTTDCVFQEPKSVLDTTHNIADKNCFSASVAGAVPWTFVAAPQAEQICAKSGKRLPTATEWFLASLGTPDSLENCNLSTSLSKTGAFAACVSGQGAFDTVGNVWELTSELVDQGTYNSRSLPESGYVSEIDQSGIALVTANDPNPIYNQDYFWSTPAGRFVMMRGGFYGSKNDGGIYATHTQADANFASAAVGFRCVQDL